MKSDFVKIVMLGTGEYGRVWSKIEVQWKNKFCNWAGNVLSITGVEGPLRNGNCKGCCGQIVMSRPVIESPSAEWSQALIKKFWNIWDRWHLNDMRAECEHQRERGETYGTHPNAICPDCGYALGSRWLQEDIPENVIEFLKSLPDTNLVPAWI